MSAKDKSPAARRSAMRNAPEEDPEFQIAPMIDILLVLLVFFMSISSTEVLQTNDKVKLCVAKDAKDKEKSKTSATGQAIVNELWGTINNAGSIDMDDVSYNTPADLTPVLKAKVDANPKLRVLLRADKQARYEYTKALLKALAAAGVSNVTFAVVDKEEGAPATAPAP